MRPRLRKWLKRTAIGVVGLIALAFATTAVVLQTDWGQRQIREQVEKALAGTFAGEVDIGDMDVGMFGSVELTDLTIKYPNGELALSVDRLTIDCNILPLLAARVRCGTLTVETPQFWHRPDAGALLRPSDEEPEANVKIAAIVVRDGRVEIPGEVFPAIEAEIAKLVVRGPDVAAGIKALSARVESRDRALSLEGAVALADNVLTLSGGAVASGDSVLVLELEKLDLDSGELRASVAGEVVGADVPVDGWRSKIAPDLAIAGNVNDATVAVNGTVGLDRGTVEIDDLELGKRIVAKLNIRDLDPSSLHAAAPKGSVSSEGGRDRSRDRRRSSDAGRARRHGRDPAAGHPPGRGARGHLDHRDRRGRGAHRQGLPRALDGALARSPSSPAGTRRRLCRSCERTCPASWRRSQR